MARVLQQSHKPDYRRRVLDLTDSPSVVKIERLGDKNPDRLFYLIEYDYGDYPTGFFWLLNDTVKRLELARRLGAEPYIRYINTPLCLGGNAFEKYFTQTTDTSYEDILKSQNVIISKVQDGFERDSFVEGFNQQSEALLKDMGALYKEFIRLRPEISERLERDIKASGMSGELENSIGIHFRGTDFKQSWEGHGKYISYEDYVPAAKKLQWGGVSEYIHSDR